MDEFYEGVADMAPMPEVRVPLYVPAPGVRMVFSSMVAPGSVCPTCQRKVPMTAAQRAQKAREKKRDTDGNRS